AEALQLMETVDTLVVDKTGTLTEGKPRLAGVTPVEGVTEAELLRAVASLERGSEHPLAAAILRGAEAKDIALAPVADFAAETGKGITGKVDGRPVAAGNLALLQALGIPAGDLPRQAEERRRAGETVLFAAIDGKAAGLVAVADPIKAQAAEALQALSAEGLHVVMLTGDSRTTAEA